MEVRIGSYNMRDFGLKLLSVELGTPSVRKNSVTIPGRNGTLDLTESVTGYPVYENATHKLTFDFCDGNYTGWMAKASDLRGKLHGRRLPVVLGDDAYYYDARISVDTSKINQRYSQVVITLDAQPYKLALKTSLEDWEWDSFNFETDVIREYTDIQVPCEYTIIGDVMPTGCTFVCDAPGVIIVWEDGEPYAPGAGRNYYPDILITEGEHKIQFKGEGKISVEYRGGRF